MDMLMSASDLAYMKGEAATRPEDGAEMALARAIEYGYLVPDSRQLAFMQGFLHSLGESSTFASQV